MKNKVVLVTGATGGIGLETALGIARRGATVIVAGRDEARSENAVGLIRRESGNNRVRYLLADLSSVDETLRLAGRVQAEYDRLDVLINNVGGIYMRRGETRDGIENTFAVNYLTGRFLLTLSLLDVLRASAPARIVNVSSAAHAFGRIHWDDLMLRRRYSSWSAYGQAKLADVMFTYELARRLEASGVTANVLHPGVVATNFMLTNNPPSAITRLMRKATDLFSLSAEQGAQTPIYLATDTEVSGATGRYFANRRAVRSAPASYRRDDQRRLWQRSEELLADALRPWGAAGLDSVLDLPAAPVAIRDH